MLFRVLAAFVPSAQRDIPPRLTPHFPLYLSASAVRFPPPPHGCFFFCVVV